MKRLGSLSLTSAGTFCFAASLASWPKVAFFSFQEITPFATRISETGACHFSAAAATSIARATAPALRSCSHELASAVLPPVPCAGPHRRLLYFAASAGAPSTRTCDQSASSSSATSVGRPVYVPWPISRCLTITVTVLSLATRTKALAAKPRCRNRLSSWPRAAGRPSGNPTASSSPPEACRKRRRLAFLTPGMGLAAFDPDVLKRAAMEYAQLNPSETNVYRAPEEFGNALENPWAAVGIGFGVGVLLGTLVTLLALKSLTASSAVGP